MASYDTNNTAICSYQPHGRLKIDVLETGIVKTTAKGPFNLELVQALANIDDKAQREYSTLFGKWCEIVIFECSCMATEDAIAYLMQHISKIANTGLAQTACAFVLPENVEGSGVMQKKYESCFAKTAIQFRCFSTEMDAIGWLREQLIDD